MLPQARLQVHQQRRATALIRLHCTIPSSLHTLCNNLSPHINTDPTVLSITTTVAPERVGRPGLQSNRASHWRDWRADVEHRRRYAPTEPEFESATGAISGTPTAAGHVVVHHPGRRHSRTSGCTSLLDPYQPSYPAHYYDHVPSWWDGRPGLQPNDTGNRRDRNTCLERSAGSLPANLAMSPGRNHFRHADQCRHLELHGER